MSDNVNQYFHNILKEMSVPCIVTNIETNIIVYLNHEFENLINNDFNLVGETFDYFIDNYKVKGSYTFKKDLKQTYDKFSYDVYVKESDTHLKIVNIRIDFLNQPFNLAKIYSIDENQKPNMTFDDAMTQCLYAFNKDDEKVLPRLLETLTQYYKSERAYVYTIDTANSKMWLTAQYSSLIDKEYIFVDVENKTELDVTLMLKWFDMKQEYGIISADSQVERIEENSLDMEILNSFNLRNFTLSLMENNDHETIGMVGISNYDSREIDNRLLRAMSKLLTKNITNNMIGDATSLLYKDMLTGFYNRDMYSKRMDEIKANPPKKLGVISANINGLKEINDNLGNVEGDNQIRISAQFLQEHFGYEFFRISGDEFIGLALDIDKDEFEQKVVDIHQIMKTENNYGFSLGGSFGSGNYDFYVLIRDAETIMYINKQEYYHTAERNFDSVRDNLLSNLLSYLANDEFMIYLQPQVRLKDASLYGAEALIRRFDKTNQKMVFPDQFIPLYEQKSIIRHVDIFVINQVCKLLNEWSKIDKAIPISVNLSRVTLLEFGIVDTIVDICDKYNIPHNLLVIEVTERVGLIENDVESSLIKNFKNNGFNVSLDDFGCAYSNIVTLSQIEVDEVKIDKSLVDNLTTNHKNHILVKNVLTMCNELEGASTLAEGIEYEEQAKLLHELGCHLGQGYFYSRPITVEDFVKNYIN